MYYRNEDGEIVHETVIRDMFDNDIDSVFDDAEVFGSTYSPSKILKMCDPATYESNFHNWTSAQGWDSDDV